MAVLPASLFGKSLRLSIVLNFFIYLGGLSESKSFLLGSIFPSAKTSLTSLNLMPTDQSTTEAGPVWDPVLQIYVGGEVPGATNDEVQEMIQQNEGKMPVFGYGSLCWKPGGVLAHPNVTSSLGKALSYRRCWAQKSTDHRGEPRFPGIVCTLLKEEEYRQIRGTQMDPSSQSGFTEGVLYVVPPELVEECLEELDFREKGGYAREIIEVVEDASGRTLRALLYRGTPDNPAIWPRALRDLPYAAAVLSVATGPSGKNDFYLNSLNEFLERATTLPSIQSFDDTVALAQMAKEFQTKDLFFLFGSGSNQHNQLLLESESNAAMLENGGEDAHNLKEVLLCVESEQGEVGIPKEVLAGGGHSGLLTTTGKLFLFGWNERGQLGKCRQNTSAEGAPRSGALPNLAVEKCFMGHHHTLIIEMGTRQLWAFGDNSRGQVSGQEGQDMVEEPLRPTFLLNERVIDASCGLFHSAAVTEEGDLVTFGCGRFGQALETKVAKNIWTGRWRPESAKVVKVACGRRHTIILDNLGRLYSLGDNKYGQLGRVLDSGDRQSAKPERVKGPWEDDGWIVDDIKCGWSHSIVQLKKTMPDEENDNPLFYGWGRNDKGQLGLGPDSSAAISVPTLLFKKHPFPIQEVQCGSEFTIAVNSGNEDVWSTGWNEHGNLALNHDHDVFELTKITGATITNPPGNPVNARLCVAAGGGHVLLGRVA